VIRLAELLQPQPSSLWRLVRQCGVTDVVTLLSGAEQEARWLLAGPRPLRWTRPRPGEEPWGEAALRDLRRRYAEHGLTLVAVEDTAPMDEIRLGGPRRDEQIDDVLTQIRAMGRLGIGVLCYNWMAVTSWARTAVAVPWRGGALTTGYRHSDAEALGPLAADGEVTEDVLWASLEYFLRAVVPVAEEEGVTLGLHPDDPPLPRMRGLPRIMRSPAAYRRLLDLVPSPANAVTFCQGNWSLMRDAAAPVDLPTLIREFGGRRAIAFVHFRDVAGDVEDFVETFHDEGRTDLVECMTAYAETGFAGPLRPDHVPTLDGEDNGRPGYATLGRLFALGYIRGVQHAAYGDRPITTR
jgi:mannonate dehydratase